MLGCLFLIVAILDLFQFYSLLVLVLQQLVLFAEPSDPKLIAGSISAGIVTQLVSPPLYILPLIFCSIASFKYKLQANWYKRLLKVFGVVMVLTPPINTLIGVYIVFLGWRKNI